MKISKVCILFLFSKISVHNRKEYKPCLKLKFIVTICDIQIITGYDIIEIKQSTK